MNISGFDLNLLRVLDALLSEGSTVAAGRKVGLSQPAVSAALSRLRHALNDPLFVRSGRNLVATDYARSLQRPLRDVLDQTEEMLGGPQEFAPARSDRSFKISGLDFFAEMLMPDLADRVWKQAPGMRVQLVDLVPDRYLAPLEGRHVDIALLPKMDFPQWADAERMFQSPFDVIARADHPRISGAGIEEGAIIPIDLFCDLGHVLCSPDGKLHAMGDEALARVGRKRRVVMSMPVFSGIATAVARSDLVAIIPSQMARRLAPRVGLRTYLPPMPITAPQIYMVWHRRATRDPAHCWMRRQIASLLARLDEPQRDEVSDRAAPQRRP